jgi:hypothetical protein
MSRLRDYGGRSSQAATDDVLLACLFEETRGNIARESEYQLLHSDI